MINPCESPCQADGDRPPKTAAAACAAPGRVDGWLSAASVYYLTSLMVALGFSLGLYFVRPAPRAVKGQPDLQSALENYDAHFYTEIATDGYFYDAGRGSSVAFFPAYPLLGRVTAMAFRLPIIAAMLIASNACFLASLILLWFYARARFRTASAEVADWVVLAAAVIPTGCFFRLAYSESTFLFVSLLAMYGIERRWVPWRVALVVGLSTAARPVGVALLAPLACYVWRELRGTNLRWARITAHLAAGCWGLAAYMCYQYLAFGEPLAFAKTQQHWGHRHAASATERVLALATLEPIWSVYGSASTGSWSSRDVDAIPWFSLQFANPIFFAAAVLLVVIGGWRRWLSAYEISAGLLLLLTPYVTRAYEMQMSSMGRFVIVVFPIYLVLGQLLARLPFAVASGLVFLAAFFLGAYSALYAAGYAIF